MDELAWVPGHSGKKSRSSQVVEISVRLLRWFVYLAKVSSKKRMELVEIVFRAFVEESKDHQKNRTFDYSERMRFVGELKKGKRYELVGFTGSVNYLRHKPYDGHGKDELDYIFEHPFANHTLMFWDHKVGCIVITNPYLRFGESKEGELRENVALDGITKNMDGFSG